MKKTLAVLCLCWLMPTRAPARRMTGRRSGAAPEPEPVGARRIAIRKAAS